MHADHYVAALPVEVMRQLASPALRAAEPRLKGLDRLVTRWMNGVLFYLDRDVPLVNGHAIYIDSEWSLTSISQKQFWPGVDLAQRGDGRTRGILSIDVSEWQRPGRRTGKVAQRCSREEIFDEVWGQLEDHLDDALDGVQVVDRFLDPAIVFPNPTDAGNLEPLLVNTAGSWADRPDAVTRIPNLFLASDYVRTHTDLATMEAANEAARRAVNGILDATRSSAPRCGVWRPPRAARVRPGARAGPGALEALPPPGQAAVRGHRRRRAAPERAGVAGAARGVGAASAARALSGSRARNCGWVGRWGSHPWPSTAMVSAPFRAGWESSGAKPSVHRRFPLQSFRRWLRTGRKLPLRADSLTTPPSRR